MIDHALDLRKKPTVISMSMSDARSKPEGGVPLRASMNDRDTRSDLAGEEEHVLRCLGAAVIMHWDDLPVDVQRELFDHAIAMGEPRRTEKLKKKIAQFIHKHHNA